MKFFSMLAVIASLFAVLNAQFAVHSVQDAVAYALVPAVVGITLAILSHHEH